MREYPSASEGQVFALVADTRGLLISGHKGTQVTCFTGTKVQILTQKALLSVDINSRVYNRMRVHTGQVEIPTFTQLYVYQHLLNLVLSE